MSNTLQTFAWAPKLLIIITADEKKVSKAYKVSFNFYRSPNTYRIKVKTHTVYAFINIQRSKMKILHARAFAFY